MVVVVFGLPGSGKSYFAWRLAKIMRAVYISSDKVRIENFKQKKYSEKSKKMVYQRMMKVGIEALKENQDIVFDGTFYLRKIRKMICENFSALSNIYFIEVLAPEGLIKERTQKKREFSDANYDVYRKLKKTFEPMRSPHLQLTSSNENLKDMIQTAMNHLRLNEKL